MKKMISAACAAALALTAASSAVSAESYDGKLAVLGDSITSGYGLDGYVSGDNTSAADSFSNKLAADFSEYVNLAVDGRTSEELLEALDSDENVSAAVENAEAVVISIGGNDFLTPMMTAAQTAIMSDPDIMQGIMDGTVTVAEAMESNMDMINESVVSAAKQVDVQLTVDNIGSIVDKVTEISPDSEIYLLTVYNPFEGVDDMEKYSEAAESILPVLNSGISDIAEQDNVHLIDAYTAFKGHALEYTNIASVDIHPNKAGHEVIYDLICEALPEVTAEEAPEAPEAAEAAEPETQEESAPTVSATPVPDTGNTDTAVYAAAAVLSMAAVISASKKRR